MYNVYNYLSIKYILSDYIDISIIEGDIYT